jgi:hypothetical protein
VSVFHPTRRYTLIVLKGRFGATRPLSVEANRRYERVPVTVYGSLAGRFNVRSEAAIDCNPSRASIICIDRKRAPAKFWARPAARNARDIALYHFSYPTFARTTVLEETCALPGVTYLAFSDPRSLIPELGRPQKAETRPACTTI